MSISSSKKGLAYSFIPLIVISAVFGAYLSITLNNSNGSLPTITPNIPCTTSFSYDSSNPISVLVISSGSTGKICVEYSNSLNNSISFSSYISVYEYNSSGSNGVCGNCDMNVVTSDFQVNATPNSVAFASSSTPNNEKEIVTYTITVPSNITSGIYGVFLLQFCSLFPMVIVPGNSSVAQVNSSDFSSWYPHFGSCPAQVLSAQLLGVAGFRVVFAS